MNVIPELPNVVWMDPDDATIGVAKDGEEYMSYAWTGKKWRLEDNEYAVCTFRKWAKSLASDSEAWRNYDNLRDDYEYLKSEWEDARTSKHADSLLPKLQKAFESYNESLDKLEKLGFWPCGPRPKIKFFKTE